MSRPIATALRRVSGLLALLPTTLFGSCSSDSEGEDPENGQTGSIGANGCGSDLDCRGWAERALEYYTKPAMPPTPNVTASCFDTTESIESVSYSGAACQCLDPMTGWERTLGPEGIPCLAYGRVENCLWEDASIPACDEQPEGLCDELCAELVQRLTDGAAQTYDGEVRFARCNASTCEYILEVEGRCLVGGWDAWVDCTLSDEEILAAAQGEAPIDGAAGATDAP